MIDPEENEAQVWPPSKHAYSVLMEGGEIDYGKEIPWKRIEELLDLDCSRDDWRFRGEYLNLRMMLEADGYLVTERGMDSAGLRILTREEMADKIRQREFSKANDSLRKSLTLAMVPREGMSSADVKKLDHWETKTAVIGATHKMLLRRRSLPAPQNAINELKKTLKQGQ